MRDVLFLTTYEYQQLERRFLAHVQEAHAEQDFSTDFRAMAGRLGVTVKSGKHDAYFVAPDGQRIIVVEEGQSPTRLQFTGWHELTHHFVRYGRGGEFNATLAKLYGTAPKRLKSAEEALCFKAAGRLLMPTCVVQDIVEQVGHTPTAVLDLADRTGASLSAAMRRLVWMHDTPVHAFLMSTTTGYVKDTLAHGGRRAQYVPSPGFTVRIEHELRRAPFSHRKEETFEAPVPFKSGTKWPSKVRAVADLERNVVVAYFMDSFEQPVRGETPLFPDFKA